MKQTAPHFMLRLLAGCAFLVAGLAHAQYAWVDARGVRHYSDQPPPPGATVKMLKAPRASGYSVTPPTEAADTSSAAAAPAADAAAAAAPKAAPTLAAREADFQKRREERAKQEQKAAEQAKRKAALSEHCQSLQEYKSQLQSGIRVATTNASGEREFLSDDERARRLAKANSALQDCR